MRWQSAWQSLITWWSTEEDCMSDVGQNLRERSRNENIDVGRTQFRNSIIR